MRDVKFVGINEGLEIVYMFEIDGQIVEFVHSSYVDRDTGLDPNGYYPAFWKPDVRISKHPTKMGKHGEPGWLYEVRPQKMQWQDEYNEEYYEERFAILRELNENVPWDFDIDWDLDMCCLSDSEIVFVES